MRCNRQQVFPELALWERVKDGGPDELASYLEHYPDGTFASLAPTRQNAADVPSSEEARPPAAAPEPADALDFDFWDSIKDSSRPKELSAYLERHPDGHFPNLARARLACSPEDVMAAAEEPLDDAIELAFWEGVRDTQDPALLGAYLDKYPDGQFALIAQPGSRGCKERVGTRDEWRRLADAGREARQTA